MFLTAYWLCRFLCCVVKLHQNTDDLRTAYEYQTILSIIEFSVFIFHKHIITNRFYIICIVLFFELTLLKFQLTSFREIICNNSSKYRNQCADNSNHNFCIYYVPSSYNITPDNVCTISCPTNPITQFCFVINYRTLPYSLSCKPSYIWA